MYPPEQVVEEEIEDLERGSDLEFVSTGAAPPFTEPAYTYPGGRGVRTSNFAVGAAGIIDLFSPDSKACYRYCTIFYEQVIKIATTRKNTMNAELSRLDLGMEIVSGKPV